MLVRHLFQPFSNHWSMRTLHTSKTLCEAVIIDGKSIANNILNEVKLQVDEWYKIVKKKPKLIGILIGNDPASATYVNRKVKAAQSTGIDSEVINFHEKVSQKDLINQVLELNKDPNVDGLLVQLPLPGHINEQEVCQSITPSKDVDGFHLNNIGKLALNNEGIIPATALGVKELILRSKIPTFGKNAVIVGRSKHVGFPIALLLHSDGKGKIQGLDMTTTICHRFTPRTELERCTKFADIVVTCAGVPGLITEDMIKPGACVIDVGITRLQTNNGSFKLVGDVNYESVKKIAGHITPVPGGVGPMTVAMLMKNTVYAAQMRHNDSL